MKTGRLGSPGAEWLPIVSNPEGDRGIPPTTELRQRADQCYENAYLFGRSARRAARALLKADTEAMQMHLNEISRHVANGADAVLLMERAMACDQRSRRPRKRYADILPSRAAELNSWRTGMAPTGVQTTANP